MKRTVFIDGAARGNPGPAGAGAYFPEGPDGRPARELAEALGRATNNEAEYRALLLALAAAEDEGVTDLLVFSDSQLLVEQVNGRYRMKAPNLKPLLVEALARARRLRTFTIEHVRREGNRDADRLANSGADISERR